MGEPAVRRLRSALWVAAISRTAAWEGKGGEREGYATPWCVRRVPSIRGYVRMGGSYHLDPRGRARRMTRGNHP